MKRWALILTPLLALALVLGVQLEPGHPEVTATAAVALLMAVWWITEALPLGATALLPLVLFPLLGVMDGKAVAAQYSNDLIFLFIGGFLVALAMERWNLHRRIALKILLTTGTRPRHILLGFMGATSFLSMWISNSASTMMMVPIAMAIILEMGQSLEQEAAGRFSTGVLLGVAYSASVGGLATLVGTPTNVSFARIFAVSFPKAPEITFADWFIFAFPLSLISLVLLWLYLARRFCPRDKHVRADPAIFQEQLKSLGPMKFAERAVLIDFLVLVLLWLTRAPLHIASLSLPGWSGLLPHPKAINDGTVAVALALVLFALPARNGTRERILDWNTASSLPWGLILLFGGGFALAAGFKESGLSQWIGGHITGLHALPPLLLVLILCTVITFLTELTSNTATAQMILPVLAAAAVSLKLNPLCLMVPATLSCSCAFMLPVATPPNAIVFGTQRVPIATMARTGLVINLAGVLLVTLAVFLLGGPLLGISWHLLPAWAR